MEEMLLHTSNTEAATAEIESAGGRVTMQLGDELLVAQVPTDFIAKKNSFASASAHIAASASSETLTYVQAYWMAREKKTKPGPPPQLWTEKTAPVALPRETPFPDEANSPYRTTLTGKIAFAAIIVSGPGNLAISESEKNKILSEVQVGLEFWVNAAPSSANLRFALYHGFATISTTDSNYCSSYSACHDRFVNPALTAIGVSTGQAGKDQAAQYIKDHSGSDGAYIGFFSKYKQSHFAYAYFGGGPLYMQYSNDGWGSDQIDRVFAHETGHVFNAPDEYTTGRCKCSTNYGKGTCSARNQNCVDCTGSQGDCIMNSNQFTLCSYTKKHLGWCG
jgi:hypothetical protein